MKRISFLSGLIILALTANAQSSKDTSAAFRLIRHNEVIIGIYDSPNLTFVKPIHINDGGYFPGNGAITSYASTGYNHSIIAKLKFREGLYFSTGFSISMQSYLLSQVGGSDSLPSINRPGQNFNNDQYTCTFKNYYVGLPLTIGYCSSHQGWSYYADLGVEFYYNYKNTESMEDNTKGALLEQSTFYHGTTSWYWSYSPFGLINYYWSTLGVFGVLNAGLSYHITPKISAAFGSTIRFTNPFGADPSMELISAIRGLANVSLNLGLTYSFQFEDIGSFKTIDKDDNTKGFMLGFNIVPNLIVYPNSQRGNDKNGLSFGYELSSQFNFSAKFSFETGVIIDNFNPDQVFNDVYIGLPAVFKFYFPHKAGHNPLYIGAGCHIDYNTAIGYPHVPGQFARYIQPIALVEMGYEVPIATKYCLNFALGYEHELNYIPLTDNVGPSQAFSQRPQIFFSSIGFSYKFN